MKDNHADNVYALNVNDKEVYVGDVESGRKGYFCIGCGKQMQAVKSITHDIRPYFRHDVKISKGEKKCTYSDETYRHKLAKEILQIEKKIRVPAVYKYPPNGQDGAPNLISKAKDIVASSVGIEMYFYEEENGAIKYGKSEDAKGRYLLLKPDVTFFDKNKKPILFIELAATHKVSDEKRNRFIRLGIDAVEVLIPKDSPQSIAQSFKKSNRTKWIYNDEQQKRQYVSFSEPDTEGVQLIDELQRKFFEESPRCRSAQIRNLIHAIERCMESEQFRGVERNLRSEIFRVERNTAESRVKWWGICESRRKEAENNLSGEKGWIETEEHRLEQEERKFQKDCDELERRYIRKRTELERKRTEFEEEERIRNKPEEFYREIIQREEDTIREIIADQKSAHAETESFDRTRTKITEQFELFTERAISDFKQSSNRIKCEIERIESDIQAAPERNRTDREGVEKRIGEEA